MRYPELLKKIFLDGQVIHPHGMECKEMMHVRLEVDEPFFYWNNIRPLKKLLRYWGAEWAWYMSGDRENSAFIEREAKLWGDIKNEDGSLNSNYGYLIFYHNTKHPSLGDITLTPFDWSKRCLQLDRDSRQAIMTYNNGGYNYIGNLDYVCTQHQAFYIRGNRLKCFIALRSSDAIWGLPYNMPWWSFVAQQLLIRLRPIYPELELAPLEVDIYSAHIYARHYELVQRLISSIPKTWAFESREVNPGMGINYYLENFENIIYPRA